MTAPITPQLDAIFSALGDFIGSLITQTEIIRGNVNNVAMPKGAFILMTEGKQVRLSTNIATYNDPGDNTGTKLVLQPKQYEIGIDCYGPLSSDWAAILITMFNDGYARDVMGNEVVALYADDAINMPLVNGEQQYEQRWRFTAVMQYNPVVAVPQQFADELNVGRVAADLFPTSP